MQPASGCRRALGSDIHVRLRSRCCATVDPKPSPCHARATDAGGEDCGAQRGAGSRLGGTIMSETEQHQAWQAWEQARDVMHTSREHLWRMLDSIPALAWAWRPDGTTAL